MTTAAHAGPGLPTLLASLCLLPAMKRRPPPPPGQSVNITSLCDIMLSLLIFFMLVSKAGLDTGADPDLDLPTATLGITEDQFDRERAASTFVVLNVRSGGIDGNPRIYGKFVSTGEPFEMHVRDPRTGQAELEPFLKNLRGDRDDFEVYLHAAGGTPYYDIEPVQRAISRADVAGVQYAAEKPQ